jgi:hypothetical protein
MFSKIVLYFTLFSALYLKNESTGCEINLLFVSRIKQISSETGLQLMY